VRAALTLRIEQPNALTPVSYSLSEECLAALAAARLRLHVRHDVSSTKKDDGDGLRR